MYLITLFSSVITNQKMLGYFIYCLLRCGNKENGWGSCERRLRWTPGLLLLQTIKRAGIRKKCAREYLRQNSLANEGKIGYLERNWRKNNVHWELFLSFVCMTSFFAHCLYLDFIRVCTICVFCWKNDRTVFVKSRKGFKST